jgi:hypothetical protein
MIPDGAPFKECYAGLASFRRSTPPDIRARNALLPTAACSVGQVALLLAYWREMAIYYERRRDERA